MVNEDGTERADEATVAGKPSTVIWHTGSGVWVNIEALRAEMAKHDALLDNPKWDHWKPQLIGKGVLQALRDWLQEYGG